MKFFNSINAFTSGRLSKKLHSRFDLPQHKYGLAELENAIVERQGGIRLPNGMQSLTIDDNKRKKLFDETLYDFVRTSFYGVYNILDKDRILFVNIVSYINSDTNLRDIQFFIGFSEVIDDQNVFGDIISLSFINSVPEPQGPSIELSTNEFNGTIDYSSIFDFALYENKLFITTKRINTARPYTLPMLVADVSIIALTRIHGGTFNYFKLGLLSATQNMFPVIAGYSYNSPNPFLNRKNSDYGVFGKFGDEIPAYATTPYLKGDDVLTITENNIYSSANRTNPLSSNTSYYLLIFPKSFAEKIKLDRKGKCGFFIYVEEFINVRLNAFTVGSYFYVYAPESIPNSDPPKFRAFACNVMVDQYDGSNLANNKFVGPAVMYDMSGGDKTKKFKTWDYGVFNEVIDISSSFIYLFTSSAPEGVTIQNERLIVHKDEYVFSSAVSNPLFFTNNRYTNSDTKVDYTNASDRSKEGRLYFIGAKESNAYTATNFESDGVTGIYYGDIVNDDPFVFTLQSVLHKGASNRIRFVESVRDLIIATEDRIFVNKTQGILGPKNVQFESQIRIPVDEVRVVTNNFMIFSSSKGTRLYLMEYKEQIAGFSVNELSLFSDDLYIGRRVVDMDFDYVNNILLILMEDDDQARTLHGMTLSRELNVAASFTFDFKFSTLTDLPEIKSLFYNPFNFNFYFLVYMNSTYEICKMDFGKVGKNDEDYLYFRYKLNVDPVNRKLVLAENLLSDNYHTHSFDCVYITTDKIRVTLYKDNKVTVVNDNGTLRLMPPKNTPYDPDPNRVPPYVSPKDYEFPNEIDEIWIGAFLISKMCTLPIETQAGLGGTRLLSNKRINAVGIRYSDMKYLYIRNIELEKGEDVDLVKEGSLVPELNSGIERWPLESGSDFIQQVCIEGRRPGPFNILSLNFEGDFNDG